MTSKITLQQGDCLELLKDVKRESVDLVLADPPYGSTNCAWDTPLDLELLWVQLKRVIKPAGAIVLTATQPFASVLVMSNLTMFKYDWVWNKSKVTDFVRAKLKPMGIHESVLVFSSASVANGAKQNMNYYPQGLKRIDRIATNHKRSRSNYLGYRYDHEDKNMDNTFKTAQYTQEFAGYPNTQLNIASESKTVHPTQKPVALMEYLIRTYTQVGDIVLDFVMGSGTTAVAALRTGRHCIGFELDQEYFDLAQARVVRARGGWLQEQIREQDNG